MARYILAHDLGTSGNKAVLFDIAGKMIGNYTHKYRTYYVKENQIEQNPEDWWEAVCASTKKLLEIYNVDKKDILCISFSGHMMGCLCISKDGRPLRNSIIWADTRAKKESQYIQNLIDMREFYKITGHRISPYYTASKLLWIKNNENEIYNKIYKILQSKDYIVYKLTGLLVTDYSDACGTNLFDLTNKKWSDTILYRLGIKQDILPVVLASTKVVGNIKKDASTQINLLEGTPVVLGGGDGSCAAAGAGVIKSNMIYNVLGSSSWIATASETPYFDEEMRTFNWVLLDENLYSPCGTMQSAGYSYEWVKTIINVDEFENLKYKNNYVKANDLYFLPYLLGERSPLWDSEARGAFIGFNAIHNKNDMIKAVLEGVAFNLKNILDIFKQYSVYDNIIMIGGGAKNKLWLQMISDIYNKTLIVPEDIEEATSIGAAICGGVGIGLYEGFDEIKKFNVKSFEIKPNRQNYILYEKRHKIFNKCYDNLKQVFKDISSLI